MRPRLWRARSGSANPVARSAMTLGSRTKPPRPLLGPPTAGAGRADPATTEPPRPLLGPPTAGPRLPDPRREGVRGTEPGRALLRPPTAGPRPAVPTGALGIGRTEPRRTHSTPSAECPGLAA